MEKIVVRIQGKDYTIVSGESDEYVQKVSLHVDKKMNEIMSVNPQLSTAMAAVLTSINIADEFFKSEMLSDNLRSQVTSYAEELKNVKQEINKFKADTEILKEEIHKLQIEIARKETEITETKKRKSLS